MRKLRALRDELRLLTLNQQALYAHYSQHLLRVSYAQAEIAQRRHTESMRRHKQLRIVRRESARLCRALEATSLDRARRMEASTASGEHRGGVTGLSAAPAPYYLPSAAEPGKHHDELLGGDSSSGGGRGERSSDASQRPWRWPQPPPPPPQPPQQQQQPLAVVSQTYRPAVKPRKPHFGAASRRHEPAAPSAAGRRTQRGRAAIARATPAPADAARAADARAPSSLADAFVVGVAGVEPTGSAGATHAVASLSALSCGISSAAAPPSSAIKGSAEEAADQHGGARGAEGADRSSSSPRHVGRPQALEGLMQLACARAASRLLVASSGDGANGALHEIDDHPLQSSPRPRGPVGGASRAQHKRHDCREAVMAYALPWPPQATAQTSPSPPRYSESRRSGRAAAATAATGSGASAGGVAGSEASGGSASGGDAAGGGTTSAGVSDRAEGVLGEVEREAARIALRHPAVARALSEEVWACLRS